jgi:PAC2 family
VIDPAELYDLLVEPSEVPLGLPLVAALSGFSDAGSTIQQVSDSIFANYDYTLVAEFDNDELLDYRSRRPIMFFERDHIVSYEPQSLGLYLLDDEAGNPFLFLHGYEPDFKWEAFVTAVQDLFSLFAVSSVTWVHSIPFPVPHTKPVSITVSGNRKDLIEAVSEWKPSTSVPGNVLHVLEYRLTETGMPMAGFVLLVPHYLADNDYPEAAITAFQQISAATGLVFKTDPLREESARFTKQISKQMEENEDLKRMVAQLEAGYQSADGNPNRPQFKRPEPKVPTADEIAAELEDYLASKSRNDGENESNSEEGR